MIKKLQNRIHFTLTLILTVFLLSFLLMINYKNYNMNINQSFNLLLQFERPQKSIRMNKKPDFRSEDIKENIPHPDDICILYSEQNTFQIGEMNRITNYTEEDLIEYANKINSLANAEGKWKNFLYLKREEGNNTTLYLLDNTKAMERVHSMILFSAFLSVVGCFLFFWVSLALSKWLIHPIAQAYTKQKQFISDASHELKTPLTVISANAELLESEIGSDNKWLGYIRSETKRMSHLVNELLTLTRIESSSTQPVFHEFSLSNAVEGTILPFESIAFEKGICLDMDINDSITIKGNEEQIMQLISILMDNAIKHVSAQGCIKIHLTRQHKKVIFTVSNTGEPIPREEQAKIFDRFYRSDLSRERSNERYGLGLAIAKAIAQDHKGILSVHCQNGWTSFQFEL